MVKEHPQIPMCLKAICEENFKTIYLSKPDAAPVATVEDGVGAYDWQYFVYMFKTVTPMALVCANGH